MNDFDRAERAALASTKSSTDLVARLRAYAVEYEQWNETSHYAPFKRDLYEAADALEAAEAQNLALIERLESLQFENLKLREASGEALASLDRIWVFSMHANDYPEQKAEFENALRALRVLRQQNPDSAEHDPEAHHVQDPDNFVLSEGCPACLAIAAQNRTSGSL